MKRPKLIKVTLEYDNGEIRSLEAGEARRWLGKLNGTITLGWTHGIKLPSFKWKIKKIGK